MKSPRRQLKPVALLLLLMVLSVSGWGVLSILFPELAPAWLGAALKSGGTEEKENREKRLREKDGAGVNTARESVGKRLAKGDLEDAGYLDPKALPKGLTSIDGEGGSGISRAVKKNGVWFPVYSPGEKSGSGPIPLTVIPLSIATGNPPPGRVKQTFIYQAEAIGGVPPYLWKAVLPVPEGTFSLNARDGLLTGVCPEPLTALIELFVSDAEGTTDSAKLKLVIRPEQELRIETEELSPLSLSEPVLPEVKAVGGVPPYRWSLEGTLPIGLSLNGATGQFRGVTEEAGEFPLVIRVMDAQDIKVEKSLTLICREELDIITPRALPPAAPSEDYAFRFEARGGQAPYTWEVTGGAFPDKTWKLLETGYLRGKGSNAEQLTEFSITVEDSTKARFVKTFRLAVTRLLTVVPSREKVGVAWIPLAVSRLVESRGDRLSGFRVLRDGVEVYQGAGSNFVDHGLKVGSTPLYTLIAITDKGEAQPMAEKEVALLSPTLDRAEPGRNCDPYVDRVVAFRPLSPGGYGSSGVPRNVTGPPDGTNTYAPAYKPSEVLSLHAKVGEGGSIELEFTDNIVELAPGDDITVFENVLFVARKLEQRFMEPAVISVALFPGEWYRLPCDVVPPAASEPLNLRDPFYYASGFAGINGTTGSDPTNPDVSGGDSFDLDTVAARAGLSWIRYLKIQSTGEAGMLDDTGGNLIHHPADPAFSPLSGMGGSGFDLDAVSAVHW